MAQTVSARELKWIREKYARLSDDELVQTNTERIIPEAREILASELLQRGWDQQRIDVRRSDLAKREEEAADEVRAAATGETSEVPFLAKVLMFFGGGEILFALKSLSDPFTSSTLHFVIGFVLLVLALLIASFYQKELVDDRNKRALLLSRRLAAGKSVDPFSLYLRPFVSTGLLRTRPRTRNYATPSGLWQNADTELETLLADCLSDSAPLYALGKPGEHVGAGRLLLDESRWQEAVKRLSAAAPLIFVVPSHLVGTKWEIELIKDKQYFSKTIFIMPYAVEDVTRKLDVPGEWQKTREAMNPLGLTLPEFSKDGMFFTLDKEGRIVNSCPIGRGGKQSEYRSRLLSSIRSLGVAPV